jgi:hypothetical protein
MISVVICSVNNALAAQVKRNIDTTIGVPFECIVLDNSVLKKGITEIYNLGAARARYDVICFVHEDVLFRTSGWGRTIADYFSNDPELGAVGVAGSKYKSRTLSGWSTGLPELDCCNILHIDKYGKEQRLYSNPRNSKNLEQTITLDGVFICTTREKWNNVKFDEQLLQGFHLYDIDFSFRQSLLNKVAVTFEIDMVHLTEGGDFGENWINISMLWHKFHAGNLPAYTSDIKSLNVKNMERTIRKKWLHRLKGESVSFMQRVKWVLTTKSYLYPSLWPHAGVFFVHNFFKRLQK